MGKVRNQIADQIRTTFRESGLSMKALSDRSGVFYSAVHGFLTGDQDITLKTAAKLTKTLGLELRPVRRRKKA